VQWERSPTIDCLRSRSVASAGGLSPDHYRRGRAGLVSYYALFKGWLLLSQPPSCHSMSTSLVTLSRHSGALADGLGSFPLASGHYRPPTVSLAASRRHSEFGWGRYGCTPPEPIQCSTSCGLIARGHTKICFGENQLSPRLIGLSPLPSSHPSGFQPTTVRASTTCYGRFTLLKGRSPRLRVHRRQRVALFRLAFALAPALRALTCCRRVTPRVIMQKARRQKTRRRSVALPPTACERTVSGSVSLATWRSFHLSLTVLVHYRSPRSI
jgi:hypothetical protein